MQKRNLVYIIVALSSLLLLTGFLTGFYVHAVTTAPSTLTISSGIYPGAPTYTVWTESSSFYTKDANGLTVDSGTNASTILTNVVGNMTGGGLVELGPGNFSDISVELPEQSGTWIFRGKGQNRTVLDGRENCTLFYNASTTVDWDYSKTLILEDMFLNSHGDADHYLVQAQFWNVHFSRVYFNGEVGDSASQFLRLGGSGADATPSSIRDCTFCVTDGLLYNYFIQSWYEGLVIENPVFIIENDIRGLMYILGTNLKVSHPIVHSWSGCDITVGMFYVYGGNCTVSIEDLYYNHSGAVTPTYVLFKVAEASSTIYAHNIRVGFSNSTLNFFGAGDGRYILTGFYNLLYFENSGNNEGNDTATTVTFPHGLAATPTYIGIQLTNYFDTLDVTWWATADGTDVTVTVLCHDGSLPVAWQVNWYAVWNPQP